jgi:cell migration-inducing and hyaluronan-binding protein
MPRLQGLESSHCHSTGELAGNLSAALHHPGENKSRRLSRSCHLRRAGWVRMKTLKSLALLFAAAFPADAFSQSAGAAPCCTVQAVGGRSAVASGLWSAPAIWGGTLPAAGARVSIPAGMAVVLDTNPPALKALFVEGKLRIAPRDTQLAADWVMIHGLFEAGTAAAPFKHRLTITLNGKNKTENVVCSGMPMGAKFVSVMNGGRLSLHAPPATAWSRLVADSTPGARQIIVADARGWQPGDTIVIAPRVAKRGQTEKRVLLAVNGSTLTLDKPLSFHHSGTMPVVDGRTLDMRSEVGRLDRRIVIQGDTDSTSLKFGGHVMIMAGGSAQVDGVELRRMGQFNKLGRYPFHWHLLGDAPGQYLRNSSIHSSFQRGVVIHGTRQTLVENNVVFDTPGHNYSIEDSTATDNLLHNNLALENRVISLTEATLREQGDNQAANFWIRSARFILPSSNLALPPPLSPRSRSRR